MQNFEVGQNSFVIDKVMSRLLGYGQNIQSGWNINAAEFIIFIP